MQSFYLNMDSPEEITLYAKQGDSNSRFVRLFLISGGTAYTPPAGASFTIRYGKGGMPKGWYDTIELDDGTTHPAIEQNGSVLTIELAPPLLAVPGENRVCLLIHGTEEYQLGTWNFRLLVQGDPNPNAVQSEEYINITASTLSKVAEVAAKLATFFTVSTDEPATGPALWFNTGVIANGADVMLLSLEEDETGAQLMADVEGETYAVENAAVNTTPTKQNYNFEIV